MNKTLIILRHEFSNTIKRKSFIIMTLAFPILALVAILGYQAIQGMGSDVPVAQTITVGYVDKTGVFEDFTAQGNVILAAQATEEEAFETMLDGDTSQYIVIPQDYLSTGLVQRFTLDRELEPPYEVQQAIKDFLIANLLQGQVDDSVLGRVSYPLSLNSITLDRSGQVDPEQGGYTAFIVPYIFSLLLIMSIFASSGFLLQGLGEEKENRIMEILLSSVSPMQLITGKVLGLGAAGLVQILVWFVSARFIAGMASSTIGGMLSSLQISTDFLVLGLVYFVLGYFLFAVIMAGTGSIGATARESQQLSMVFTFTAVVPFFFMASIIENPDSVISQVFTLFPLTAPITAIMRLGLTDIPVWQIATSIVLMLVSVIVLFILAAKIFRTFLLMYGKTPRLGEIVRYLRQA